MSSALENYSRFLPKRKQGAGDLGKSPRKNEVDGRERGVSRGEIQSKRLHPCGSFSPWKINLHLILLRNCSSLKQMESMRFIFF